MTEKPEGLLTCEWCAVQITDQLRPDDCDLDLCRYCEEEFYEICCLDAGPEVKS
jgi:hypothetical protein